MALGAGTVQVCTAAMVYGFKIVQDMKRWRTGLPLLILVLVAWWMLGVVHGDGPKGSALGGLWITLAAWVLLLWFVLDTLARQQGGRATQMLAPALFGLALIYLWELLVVGWQVPKVLLPAPHARAGDRRRPPGLASLSHEAAAHSS